MRYFSYDKYKSEAIEGVNHIKVRSYKWMQDAEQLLPKLKSCFENYDLHFSKRGLLQYSCHFSLYGRHEMNRYSYHQGKIVNIQTVYLPEYDIKCVSSFLYDKNGRLLKEILINGSNESEEPEVYDYIYSDKLITEIHVEPYEGIEHKVEIYLNEDGQQVEFKVYRDGEFEYGDLLIPSQKQPLVENRERDGVINFEYIFDAKGNWITKTIFENGVPKEIVERVLHYY